jgi:hypothetical protein
VFGQGFVCSGPARVWKRVRPRGEVAHVKWLAASVQLVGRLLEGGPAICSSRRPMYPQ